MYSVRINITNPKHAEEAVRGQRKSEQPNGVSMHDGLPKKLRVAYPFEGFDQVEQHNAIDELALNSVFGARCLNMMAPPEVDFLDTLHPVQPASNYTRILSRVAWGTHASGKFFD